MVGKYDSDGAITRKSLYGTMPEPTYAGVTSFMRRKYTRNFDEVDVVVAGVPLESISSVRPASPATSMSSTGPSSSMVRSPVRL